MEGNAIIAYCNAAEEEVVEGPEENDTKETFKFNTNNLKDKFQGDLDNKFVDLRNIRNSYRI